MAKTLAKQNGPISSSARWPNPIDHDLAGRSAKLKETRSAAADQEELVELLGLKQAELKQAKLLAAQMAKIPPARG